MGSLPRPRPISDSEVVERYLAGEARGTLGLRCKVGDSVILAILQAAGVPLRSGAESKRLSHQARMATMARRRR
jgi:hypothetical protein